MRQLKWKEKQ